LAADRTRFNDQSATAFRGSDGRFAAALGASGASGRNLLVRPRLVLLVLLLELLELLLLLLQVLLTR